MVKRLCLFLLFLVSLCVVKAQEYSMLTNIPTVYIETFDNEPITSKEDYIYANMIYVTQDGETRYDSLKIRGRGNSTWGLAKKPYRIKFKESTKFLGKGFAKNKSWVFLANHADKSLLRNAVTFTMGEFMGLDFNPAAHFVDLVLNGTYLGNYQITDQINVDNKRVEVFEQEEFADDTANITGGYLLEVDGFGYSEPYNFHTDKGVLLSIKSPDEDVINDRQVEYIKGCLNGFENALFSSDFTDPENGYRAHVDSASFINWYMATELSANVDGFWSTYMYKDRDNPKLYFGPLWDYDIAYNNCNRVGDVERRSMVDAAFADNLSKLWVKQAMNDPWFNNAVRDAWKTNIDAGIVEYLCNYIDSMANVIDESQRRNFGRYSLASRVYNEIYLYSTYSEYIQQLKDFIVNHSEFLTELFDSRVGGIGDGGGAGDGEDDGDEEPVLEPFTINDDYYYRIYNKGTNKVLDLLADGKGGYDVVMFSPEFGRDTQLWQVETFDDGFRFINRATGLAFNDPSEYRNETLDVAPVDESDLRQKWFVVTVNENNNYNVINAYTDRAINNSGGSSGEGNPVISYDNDDRNYVSNNRQWKIVPEVQVPDYIDEEVKEALRATVALAEEFISGLDADRIGDGYFCYDRENMELLQRMIADAKGFESTVADDYILQNVNLAEQLDVARRINLPEEDKMFVIRHKQSGYALNVASGDLGILRYDGGTDGQHVTFVAAEEGDAFMLRSAAGLYVSAKYGVSLMQGTELPEENGGSLLRVEFAESGAYYIRTANGLMGTVNTRVYSNRPTSNLSEWLLEEYVIDDGLSGKRKELEAVLVHADSVLNSIDYSWTGERPFQVSRERYEALVELTAEMKDTAYNSAEEFDAAIDAIRVAVEGLSVLNRPDVSKTYNLVLDDYRYLNFTNGMVVNECGELDESYEFAFIPVDGKKNTYYISVAGRYMTVINTSVKMVALSDTPRGIYGEYVVEQVGRDLFTLTTACGLFGVAGEYPANGDPCIPDAVDYGANVQWGIMEASSGDDYTGIADYTDKIEYRIRYDREMQELSFVSYDIEKMSDVDVSLYTVGGRLLYVFKATECLSLENLPTGTYIVAWTWGGKERNVKFRKE